MDVRTWPLILDTGQYFYGTGGCTYLPRFLVMSDRLTALFCFPDDLPKKRPAQIYKPSNPDTLAYLDFSVSTTGMLAGVKVRGGVCGACRPVAF